MGLVGYYLGWVLIWHKPWFDYIKPLETFLLAAPFVMLAGIVGTYLGRFIQRILKRRSAVTKYERIIGALFSLFGGLFASYFYLFIFVGT